MPPVNARAVLDQPGENQDQLKVGQREHLKGEEFSMMAVNAKVKRVAMGDRTSGRAAPIDKFNKDRIEKRERVQMV